MAWIAAGNGGLAWFQAVAVPAGIELGQGLAGWFASLLGTHLG